MNIGNKVVCVLILLGIIFSQLPVADPVEFYLFCIPSAYCFAAPLSGGYFYLEPGQAVIAFENYRILVPPSCSGMLFFLLLALLFPIYRKWQYVIISYPIALLANGLRIIAVSMWSIDFGTWIPLPGEFQHQFVGILIFLPVLLLIAFVLHLNSKCQKKEP